MSRSAQPVVDEREGDVRVTHPGPGWELDLVVGVTALGLAASPFLVRLFIDVRIPIEHPAFLGIVALAVTSGAVYGVIARRMFRGKAWITLGIERLTVGRGPRARGQVVFSMLNEMTAVDSRTSPPRLVLAQSGERALVVPFRDAALRSEVMGLILARLPESGQRAVGEIDRNREYTLRTWLRLTPCTAFLGASVVSLYVAQTLFGSIDDHVTRWGIVSALVRQGEVYRLLTANLVHVSTMHAALNVMALISLGSVVESIHGTRLLAAVVAISALAGQLAATLTSEVAVGASGMVYGILGAFCFSGLARWDELPATHRLGRLVYLFPPVAILVVEPLVPHLSVAGHVAGFASGWLTAWLLVRGRSLRDRCLEAARPAATAQA